LPQAVRLATSSNASITVSLMFAVLFIQTCPFIIWRPIRSKLTKHWFISL